MRRFNLSEWAIMHQPLVLFMILLLGAGTQQAALAHVRAIAVDTQMDDSAIGTGTVRGSRG